MARLLQAMTQYGPRVERKETAPLDDVARLIALSIGLSDSQVTMVLRELHKAVLFYNRKGTPVKLPGLGIFGVSVDRDGRRRIAFYADRELREIMNSREARGLPIRNSVNIGLDNAGYKALWDADHPDDPLEIPEAELKPPTTE